MQYEKQFAEDDILKRNKRYRNVTLSSNHFKFIGR